MSFSAYRYRIPFTEPVQTSKMELTHREGFILTYWFEQHELFGEAAPLAGFSPETMSDIQNYLSTSQKDIENSLNDEEPVNAIKKLYEKSSYPAALQFGLDSLAYQLEARRRGMSLRRYLHTDSPKKISLNALLSLQSSSLLNDVEKYIAEGFTTLKFKVGMDFSAEMQRLKTIRDEFPDVIIRVDANQAWSIEEALIYGEQLSHLNLAYCEEPLKKPTPKNIERFYNNVSLDIALDESILHTSYWPNLLPFTSAIVLKPMFLGSFTNFFETIKLANTHDNEVVVTSSLESSIGRNISGVLALGLTNTEIAHGLNTGELLQQDLVEGGEITNGIFYPKLFSKESINFEPLQKVI